MVGLEDFFGSTGNSTSSLLQNYGSNNGLSNFGTFQWGGNGLGGDTSGLGGLANLFGGDLFGGLSQLGSLLSGGLQAFSGLQNYKLGQQALGLSKDQFNFQKGLANRNLANQAKTVNNTYDTAAQVGAGMQGAYGQVNQSDVDRWSKAAKDKHVDGSPI